jgi:hypothetical protein
MPIATAFAPAKSISTQALTKKKGPAARIPK